MTTYILLVQHTASEVDDLSDNKDGWQIMETTTNPQKVERWKETMVDVLAAHGVRKYVVMEVPS